jgi:peptidoglycan/xylan/chitin deacetylase (PgdA/CDA1 family)
MIFKYVQYLEYLKHIKSLRPITTMGKACGDNDVILRHDVDFDIDAAYRMSEIEASMGVRSTYFILITSDMYNPASAHNRALLQKMAAEGFEIGLHHDPSVDESIHSFRKNISALEGIIDKRVKSVSIHNPTSHGIYPEYKGYNNAYSKKYFSPDRYMSDSCMCFRDKHPYKFIADTISVPVQILLHPIHYTDNGDSYPEIFARIIKKKIDTTDAELQVNRTYKKQITNLYEHIRA